MDMSAVWEGCAVDGYVCCVGGMCLLCGRDVSAGCAGVTLLDGCAVYATGRVRWG